ncbi:MAG: hypothetical protein HC876_03510 [Chloroflexaceae bacterium]|nr:hypothetical protein [Chloroflexaceae bacterium]
MEDFSINLRPIFEVPLRWWRFIITMVTLVAIVAGAINLLPFLIPDIYRATAGVAIVKSRTEVSFESAVETLTEEQIQAALGPPTRDDTTAEFRRATLVSLVNNGTIAEQVLDQLQDRLPEGDLERGILSRRVAGQLANDGDSDLIQIVVTHPNPEIAAAIANAWAASYERLINDIYARPSNTTDSIQEEVTRAKQIYDDAQETLIQSLAENRISQAQRQINEKTRILNVLLEARQRAISTTINFQVERDAELYTAYLAAQSANRLMAFQKEQDRKRDLVAAYIDAQTDAQLSTFEEQAADRQRILDEAYERKALTEQLLERARVLQQQAQQGGDAQSAALALAFLKMDVAGVLDDVQVTELNVSDLASLAPDDFVTDTTALVAALEAQLASTEATIASQTELLVNDAGLDLPEPPSESELTELIAERYPELFEPGELGQLSTAILDDNPLARSALLVAEDLLQLRDRQDLIGFSSADTPLNDAINDLEEEVRVLEAQIERDRGLQLDLMQQRDLAFETYSTLARKAAEITVADQVPGTEVRFAAEASIPTRPANDRDRIVNIALIVFLTLVLSLFGTVILEFSDPNMLPRTLGGPTNAPWNRLLRWIFTPSSAIPSIRTPRTSPPAS